MEEIGISAGDKAKGLLYSGGSENGLSAAEGKNTAKGLPCSGSRSGGTDHGGTRDFPCSGGSLERVDSAKTGDKAKGLLYSGGSLAELAGLRGDDADVFLLADRNVRGFADDIASRIPLRSRYFLTADEAHKDMAAVMEICDWLLRENAGRNALLIAVGGGITTDLAGFAAAIYKRGIRTAFVPTTLLAQVDAAIGGKNGVDFRGYKNMLGTIRRPEFTFLCTETLRTLPYRHFLDGEAELLKTFLIDNRNGNYERAVALCRTIREAVEGGTAAFPSGQPDTENGIPALADQTIREAAEGGTAAFPSGQPDTENGIPALADQTIREAAEGGTAAFPSGQPDTENGIPALADPAIRRRLSLLIREAARIKSDITGRDPEDHGERRKLNLGHTFAHAIEWKSGFRLSHGRAVAMGVLLAARLSERLGVCGTGLTERLSRDFTACGLPTSCPYDSRDLLEALKKDKKAAEGRISFVLLAGIGKVLLREMEPERFVKSMDGDAGGNSDGSTTGTITGTTDDNPGGNRQRNIDTTTRR